MKCKITVKRYDHQESIRTINRRTGKTVTIPAGYECYYYWNSKEIAYYRSKDDTVYLRTDYLARPISNDYIGRMKRSPIPEMWEDLIEFLDIDENTTLSEYTTA